MSKVITSRKWKSGSISPPRSKGGRDQNLHFVLLLELIDCALYIYFFLQHFIFIFIYEQFPLTFKKVHTNITYKLI